MTNVLPMVIKCGSCFQFHFPSECILIGESVYRCLDCQEKHDKAIDELGKTPPRECADCHTSWDTLRSNVIGETVPMYPHWQDGGYHLLCRSCSDKRMIKTPQAWRNTRFGYEKKLF